MTITGIGAKSFCGRKRRKPSWIPDGVSWTRPIDGRHSDKRKTGAGVGSSPGDDERQLSSYTITPSIRQEHHNELTSHQKDWHKAHTTGSDGESQKMEWSNNNAACVTTWSVLRLLEAIPVNTTFVKCGGMKVSDLRHFGADASPEMLAFQADSLAASMDNIFVNVRKATYESGVKKTAARSAISAVLRDGTKTLPELAEVIDEKYVFLLEAKA